MLQVTIFVSCKKALLNGSKTEVGILQLWFCSRFHNYSNKAKCKDLSHIICDFKFKNNMNKWHLEWKHSLRENKTKSMSTGQTQLMYGRLLSCSREKKINYTICVHAKLACFEEMLCCLGGKLF